jgi:hypothetical protein
MISTMASATPAGPGKGQRGRGHHATRRHHHQQPLLGGTQVGIGAQMLGMVSMTMAYDTLSAAVHAQSGPVGPSRNAPDESTPRTPL